MFPFFYPNTIAIAMDLPVETPPPLDWLSTYALVAASCAEVGSPIPVILLVPIAMAPAKVAFWLLSRVMAAVPPVAVTDAPVRSCISVGTLNVPFGCEPI